MLISSLDTIYNSFRDIETQIVKLKSENAQIAESLETLNRHNSIDLYVRAGTVLIAAISVLVAFRLFYLNRNKEFRIKRSEIAGEIYSCFFDYKRLRLQIAEKQMLQSTYAACLINLDGDDNEEKRNEIKKILRIDTENNYSTEVEKLENDIDKIRKDLQKYIGQYRFYVSKAEKAALKFHSNTFNETEYIQIFDNDESNTEIFKSFDQQIFDKTEELRELLDKQYEALETIIDDYSSYVKKVHLFPRS